MRTTTATFDTENAKSVNQPVFKIEFTGVTRTYSSGTFTNETANNKQYLSSISISPTFISMPKNNVKIGTASITLLDKDLDVTTQISNNLISNRSVTIKYGFQAIDDTDFTTIGKFRITDMQLEPSKLAWKITCQDVSRFFGQKIGIFEQRTSVNDATGISTSDTTITVDSTTGFIDPTNLPGELKTYINPGIRIDDEIMSYTALTGTTFTVNRAQGQTYQVEHDDNSDVSQVIVFNHAGISNPNPELLKVLLHIMLTTDDASGHAYYDMSNHDSNFKGFGLGLSESDVNIDQIENIDGLLWFNTVSDDKDGIYTGQTPGILALTNDQVAIEWIVDNILNPAGCFLSVDEDGKWTVGTFDPTQFRSTFTSVKTFQDADVIEFNSKIEWEPINTAEVLLFNNHATNSPRQRESFKLNESVTDYGAREQPFEIRNTFATSSGVADAWIEYNYLRRWFYIFSNPFAFFEIKVFTEHIIYEPGDLIDLTLSNEIDIPSAARGITNKNAMITGQRISLDRNGNFVVAFDGIMWDVMDEVTSFETDATTIEDSDMDDSTLDPTGTNGTALEAADAYIDPASPAAADAYRVKIQWTNPNTGAGEHNIFSLNLHAQSPTGTDIFEALLHKRIRYSTDDGNTITREFFVVDQDLAATTIDRIKIDAYDLFEGLNASAGTAPAAADRPQSMSVVSIIPTTLNKTISQL